MVNHTSAPIRPLLIHSQPLPCPPPSLRIHSPLPFRPLSLLPHGSWGSTYRPPPHVSRPLSAHRTQVSASCPLPCVSRPFLSAHRSWGSDSRPPRRESRPTKRLFASSVRPALLWRAESWMCFHGYATCPTRASGS